MAIQHDTYVFVSINSDRYIKKMFFIDFQHLMSSVVWSPPSGYKREKINGKTWNYIEKINRVPNKNTNALLKEKGYYIKNSYNIKALLRVAGLESQDCVWLYYWCDDNEFKVGDNFKRDIQFIK